ncbi:ATP synthase subunit I [Methylophilaceae bacterium]|jgi:ATP synthase protein I|nr:ATP synthase subunit I [Methylophilaceae bacterium]
MSLVDKLIEKLEGVPKQLKKMLLRQFIVLSILFVVSYYIYSIELALSIVLGFVAVIVGIVISTPLAKLKTKGLSASSVLVNILKAELVKLGVIILLLWLSFKFYSNLIPFGLMLGLIISALMSGLAISKLDNR